MKMFPERVRTRSIDVHKTILQTMKQMDDCRTKSLLAFDQNRFVGLITIGDLQRAIIAKRPFDTRIVDLVNNTGKKYGHVSDDKDHIKEWMMEVRAEMMPILDDKEDLVEVIFWEDLFDGTRDANRRTIDIPVVIMAGGKGTRLKPLTNVLPKPLIPVGEKTILEVIMDRFESAGCRKFYMSVNYKSEMMRFYVEQLEHHYNITFIEEPKPLGTIGSVSLLKGLIDTPFFVSNCDIIIDQDFRDVYDYHIANKNDLTIVTAIKSFRIPYGVVETGEDGLMTNLQEKPEVTYQINSGVYILNPECIDQIPGNEFYHVTQLMERIQKRGGRVGCFPVSEKAWTDMGEWPEYLRMIKES